MLLLLFLQFEWAIGARKEIAFVASAHNSTVIVCSLAGDQPNRGHNFSALFVQIKKSVYCMYLYD